MITVFTGAAGSGKTNMLAREALYYLKKAERDHKKYGKFRKVYLNIVLGDTYAEKYRPYFEYYEDVYTLSDLRDAVIIIDEIATYFHARDWEKMPKKFISFLMLHRHYGIDIYAATLNFNTIEKTFRQLCPSNGISNVYFLSKLISTREPSPLYPPIKRPYCWSFCGLVKEKHLDLEKEFYEYESRSFKLFTRKDFAVFDTRQDIPHQTPPPLRKEVRVCPEDGFTRTRYI